MAVRAVWLPERDSNGQQNERDASGSEGNAPKYAHKSSLGASRIPKTGIPIMGISRSFERPLTCVALGEQSGEQEHCARGLPVTTEPLTHCDMAHAQTPPNFLERLSLTAPVKIDTELRQTQTVIHAAPYGNYATGRGGRNTRRSGARRRIGLFINHFGASL